MYFKPSFAMAALLAATCSAQAASDNDLAAIRSQIDDMKKSYEQRIASLEKNWPKPKSRARQRQPLPQQQPHPLQQTLRGQPPLHAPHQMLPAASILKFP